MDKIMQHKRSTCVICLPRTGSEVVCAYFGLARNLQYGGEFLCNNLQKFNVATQISDTGIFLNDFKLVSSNAVEKTSTLKEAVSLRKEEFSKRLDIIKSFEKKHDPVIFKYFLPMYLPMYDMGSVSDLLRDFDVVILSRKNALKSIISNYVCRKVGIWHEKDPEKVKIAKESFKNYKTFMDENVFESHVEWHNSLIKLQNECHMKYPEVMSVQYEDFQDNPIEQLNQKFNLNVGDPENQHINFHHIIEDHESLITNIDKLKEIYQYKFIL